VFDIESVSRQVVTFLGVYTLSHPYDKIITRCLRTSHLVC